VGVSHAPLPLGARPLFLQTVIFTPRPESTFLPASVRHDTRTAHHHPRLRLTVHPAHRAAHTRDRRVCGDPSLHHLDGCTPGPEPAGYRALGRTFQRVCRRSSALLVRGVHPGNTRAGNMLRTSAHRLSIGRRGEPLGEAGVRSGASAYQRSHRPLRADTRTHASMDEPRRLAHEDPRGLRGDSRYRERAYLCGAQGKRPYLGHTVPSGSVP